MTKIQPQQPHSRLSEILLLGAFFFSGATGLSLEVAWSKELTYLLGVDIYATTTVVTAFMAGLGLGALIVARAGRWIKTSMETYGRLQLVVGCCALLSIPLFRLTQPLFSYLFNALGYDSAGFLLLRFLVVFAFMLIPVTLMGMTLPVVVGASDEKGTGRYAYLAGKLYGVNTLGAVVGTLTAGFLLIPALGILRTCLVAGAVDLLIGCALLWGSRRERVRRGLSVSPKERPVPGTPGPGMAVAPPVPFAGTFSWPAAVFLLSGIGALAYEIIWFRLLARIIGPTVHAFSIMLAVYLLGLAAGSLMGAGILKRIRDHRLAMAVLLACIGFGPLTTLFFINQLPIWYGMLFIQFTTAEFTIRNLLLQGVMACVLILPATLPLGAFFPVVTRAYHQERGGDSAPGSVGYLYFCNTVGGVIGSLVAGFWLVPAVGIKTAMLAAGGLSIAMALAIYWGGVSAARLNKALCGGIAVAAFLLLAFASPGMNQTVLNAGLYSEMIKKEYFFRDLVPENRSIGKLLYFQEGINNSVTVVANKFNDGNLTLHLSGSWEASTEIHGRLHLKFLGHLPMLFARDPKTVGVIGFGAGITTGAVLLHPDVQRVNVFELEPGVIQARKYFAFVNRGPLEDPRTRLFLVDGRSHITYGNIRYDVITSDPIHPNVAGASNLYTHDYYRAMAEHLNPGGVFCQWMPLAGVSVEAYNTVLNTMRRAFPHLAVFSFFGESVIIASKEPLRADWQTLEKRFFAPRVYEDMKMLDMLSPYNLVAFFLGGGTQVERYLSGFDRINTDDNVWLEHRIPIDFLNANIAGLFQTLRQGLSAAGPVSLEQVFPGIPLDRLERELALLKRDGNREYDQARQARERRDFTAMERHLRGTLADLNSVHVYPAGVQLMESLYGAGRIDEIFPIAADLQRNFPAFPEAYIAEARAWEKKGLKARAEQALNRGWIYLPGNPEMIRWRSHFGMAG